jgi:hypothetical protein
MSEYKSIAASLGLGIASLMGWMRRLRQAFSQNSSAATTTTTTTETSTTTLTFYDASGLSRGVQSAVQAFAEALYDHARFCVRVLLGQRERDLERGATSGFEGVYSCHCFSLWIMDSSCIPFTSLIF